METQLNFFYTHELIDELNNRLEIIFYIECSWESNNEIRCIIHTTPQKFKTLTPETVNGVKEFAQFNFEFEKVGAPDTLTKFLHTGYSFEPVEVEIAAQHDRYGFANCAEEVKEYITSNFELWESIEA